MLNYQSDSIITNGIKIHFYRSGQPVQKQQHHMTIIMLHGLTDNGLCWERVARVFEDQYDLILMDARGHGHSDAPDTGYGVEDRAADVAGLIDALSLGRVILLGHSMGAESAAGTAANYPDKIHAVMLEDPPWPGRFWGSSPEEREERAEAWRNEILARRSLPKDEIISAGKRANPNWDEDEWSAWADAKLQLSPNISQIATSPRRRWTDYLGKIQCPILLLMGEPTLGGIVNEQTASDAARLWKMGRAVKIPGAGHNIRREQFDRYISELRNFLAENT